MISRQSAHEGGKVVSPTHRPHLPPQEIFLALISVRGWVDPTAIVRPKGLCQWKIPVTPSQMEPAAFRLVAQYLNQLRYRVHLKTKYVNVKHVCKIWGPHGGREVSWQIYTDVSEKHFHDGGRTFTRRVGIFLPNYIPSHILVRYVVKNGKGKGHPCTGTGALYRPYGP